MDFKVEKFSYRLNALLEENNMTQTQLAKMIGTANVFNVSIDYLLGNSESKTLKSSEIDADVEMAMIIKSLYALDKNSHLSKKQIELIKRLLLANKDFILSA